MQVKDLTSLIESYAPLSLQESYDNAGLICGNPDNEVTSVLLCTDVTEAVIEEAIEGNFNLIISHHPLSIQPLKNLLPDNWIKRCLIRAVKHDLNIYAAHTNMDAVWNGVSGKMADKLELTEREILKKEGKLYSLTFYTPVREAEKVRQAVLDSGAGHIGNYSHCSFNTAGTGTFLPGENTRPFCGEPGLLHQEEEIKTEITVPDYLLAAAVKRLKEVHPYEEPVWNTVCIDNTNPVTGFGIIGELEEAVDTREFLERIKTIFHCGVIRHTALCKPQVKRIAVCGGSGAFLIRQALQAGADLYVTGDIKYHDFFNTENRLILADIGHYESEQYTKEIFYELVTKKISKFAVQFSKVNTNPINYL
ncbi:MAG: Nif3-like dinuclear metal center hexameric protein [Roseburia sp.]|nr:Nif3-like dinuclear metal center hexameric protein [Roseburia sp.]